MQDKPDPNSAAGKLVTVVALAAVMAIAALSRPPPPHPSTAQTQDATVPTARTEDTDAIKGAEAFKRANEAQAKGDMQGAFTWMRIAASFGHAVAQNNLGIMYDQGRIVTRDYGEAARWYREAIHRGESSASANLGRLYALGLGVETDLDEAERLFRIAAEHGVPTAENSLRMVQAKKVDNRNTVLTLGVGAVLLGGLGAMTNPNAGTPAGYPEPDRVDLWSAPASRQRTRPDTSVGCAWGDRAVGTCQ